MLSRFKDVLGDEFIKNTALVFTFWEQNRKAIKERNRTDNTEENKII